MTSRHATAAFLILALTAAASAADPKRDALWAAVRAGDVKAVQAALDNGADVNAQNEYGVSALWIAAGKGKLEVVELLVSKGADVNARDDIWYQTPLSHAVGGRQLETVEFLIKAGAKDVDAALCRPPAIGQRDDGQVILDLRKVSQDALDAALYLAPAGKKELKEALEKAGAKPLPPASEADRKAWAKLAGTLRKRRRREDDHHRQGRRPGHQRPPR